MHTQKKLSDGNDAKLTDNDNAMPPEIAKDSINPPKPLDTLLETMLVGQDEENLHILIGVSLVLGFILMLIIDQLSGRTHSHSGNTGTRPVNVFIPTVITYQI